MRTYLRGKITLLFLTLGLLLAIPAIALADTLIITNDVLLNTNTSKNSGDTGTANIVLNVTNGVPVGDQSGCNVDTNNPATVTLSSDNANLTFPNGNNTAQLTDCGSANAAQVSYKVNDDAQGGTAIISGVISGGKPDTTGTNAKIYKYDTTDKLTVTIVDTAPPRVTDFAPTGASEPINTDVTATFNEPVNGSTITDSTFKLEGPGGAAVAASRGLSADNKTATLNPTADLAYSTTYTVTVVGGTSGVKDVAGNGLDQDRATAGIQNKTWSFRTADPPCTPVSVTSSPANKTVTYGDNASFTAAASGDPAPTVQWQKSTDNGTTWNNVSGATSTTLSLTKPLVADSGSQYRAVFTNDCGGTKTATSNAATLTVNAKQITGSFTADNKVYDGGTSAPVLTRSVDQAEVVGSDVVTLTGGTATFADKNVGNGKTVTLTGATLGGADAANYSLTSVSTTTANITAKALTISGLSALDKVYDGNTTAQLSGTASLVGVVSINNVEDDVSLSGTASGAFNNALVGNDKPVTVSGLTLSGADAGNYSLTQLVLSADITAWTLSGFFSPVDYGTNVWNTVKGGSTVPLKFEIFKGSTESSNTADVDKFIFTGVACPGASAATDDIEITTTGGTSLRYDTTGGQFIQNWQTPKKPGACYAVTMQTDDGNKLPLAYFMLK